MSEQLKEIQRRYAESLNRMAEAQMRVINLAYHGTPFVAAPGASLWTRLKVKYWNWKAMRAYRAHQGNKDE